MTLLLASFAESRADKLTWYVTPKGLMEKIAARGDTLISNASFKIALPGWKKVPSFAEARLSKALHTGISATYEGSMRLPGKEVIKFEQQIDEGKKDLQIRGSFKTDSTIKAEGLFYWFQLPLDSYKSGSVEMFLQNKRIIRKVFPETLDKRNYIIIHTKVDKLVFQDKMTSFKLELKLDKPCYVQIQDDRMFNSNFYTVLMTVQQGNLQPDQNLRFSCRLSAEFKPLGSINILKPAQRVLKGIGGNFCFQIDSPQTDYMLDHLQVGCARVEMPLDEWEPKNDNKKADRTDWQYFRRRDWPKSKVREKFVLAHKLAKMRIPLIISVWRLPFWLYKNPANKDKDAHYRFVPRENWPEMFECILSYLIYAKDKYSIEPDYFSFNEPDLGVNVYFSPNEYAEMVKQLSRLLKRHKLKTTVLLGDVANPRKTWSYLEPVLEDAKTRSMVKALSFHSWNGGSPEDYQHWNRLAEKHQLQLFVGEVGVDPFAWKTKTYNTWDYSVKEAEMYMHLLRYAQPTGTMQWEFTADYAMVVKEKHSKLAPTDRFYFMKHLTDLTPPDSIHLDISCDNRYLSCCAFKKDNQIIIHVLNSGTQQLATIERLPRLDDINVIQTSQKDKYQSSRAFSVDKNGKMIIRLPAQSLSTVILYSSRYEEE